MTQLATDLAALQTLLSTSWTAARAVDSGGRTVAADDPGATKWDLLGAVERVCRDAATMDERVTRRSAIFAALAAHAGPDGIARWDKQPGRRASDVQTLVATAVAAVGVSVAPKGG